MKRDQALDTKHACDVAQAVPGYVFSYFAHTSEVQIINEHHYGQTKSTPGARPAVSSCGKLKQLILSLAVDRKKESGQPMLRL